MPTLQSSLVRYDNPILVSESQGRKAAQAATHAAKPPKAAMAELEAASPQTEDILNSILPPREFEESGQRWVQFVSSTPATRLDVINLQEKLDEKLLQQQAREMGICPVREALYAEAFDELIRQVTINCAERGVLLLRVRDEIRTSIAAYKTLYESSVAFGMRKALHAEQEKEDMRLNINKLERDKEELERQVADLQAKCEAIEKRELERRAADEKKHQDEMTILQKANKQLTSHLQTILNPTKK